MLNTYLAEMVARDDKLGKDYGLSLIHPASASSTGADSDMGNHDHVYYTTGVLLLRMLHEFQKQGTRTVKADQIFGILVSQIERTYGVRIYDLGYSSDGKLQSTGLMQDIAALSAAKLVNLEGDDVRITLTDAGQKFASSVRVSDTMEKIVPRLKIER